MFFHNKAMLQHENLFFYYYKSTENQGKLCGNFDELSEMWKIHEKFPRKFPEISRKIPGKSEWFLR